MDRDNFNRLLKTQVKAYKNKDTSLWFYDLIDFLKLLQKEFPRLSFVTELSNIELSNYNYIKVSFGIGNKSTDWFEISSWGMEGEYETKISYLYPFKPYSIFCMNSEEMQKAFLEALKVALPNIDTYCLLY